MSRMSTCPSASPRRPGFGGAGVSPARWKGSITGILHVCRSSSPSIRYSASPTDTISHSHAVGAGEPTMTRTSPDLRPVRSTAPRTSPAPAVAVRGMPFPVPVPPGMADPAVMGERPGMADPAVMADQVAAAVAEAEAAIEGTFAAGPEIPSGRTPRLDGRSVRTTVPHRGRSATGKVRQVLRPPSSRHLQPQTRPQAQAERQHSGDAAAEAAARAGIVGRATSRHSVSIFCGMSSRR